MAHHRRGRAKNRRAGCLMCKPHKANGAQGETSRQTLRDKASGMDLDEAMLLSPKRQALVDDIFEVYEPLLRALAKK